MSEHRMSAGDPNAAAAAEEGADEVSAAPGAEEVPHVAEEPVAHRPTPDWWQDGPVSWQLTIDSADPHAQADFWASALGYEVEDNSELIARVLAAGLAEESDTLVHHGVRSWVSLKAVRGDGRRILFQQVPEAKTVKNRVHVDLNVGSERMTAEVERLTALGATQVAEVRVPGSHHFVLQDPEGNEFCVQ